MGCHPFSAPFESIPFSSDIPYKLKMAQTYSDVVIIGAGISGVNMACQLEKELKVSNYTIYDRASEIGGAWAANKCK